jgi:hypothetical protein
MTASEACMMKPRVSRLPFDEQRPVVEIEPRGLLGKIDVECRAEENGSGRERK